MPEMPILSPKNDFVFKRLFGDPEHVAPLADFLQAALGLAPGEFAGLVVADPNLNPEFDGDKHSILDVRVNTSSGRDIDVEVQVKPSPELCDRIQCYAAKMVAGKVKAGESYRGMAQSVSIVIADFRMWEDVRYHHRFRLYDAAADLAYPNSLEIHTLELPKRPAASDGSGLWDWMCFFSSRTRDEFASLAGKGRVMAEAVARLMELSADEKTRLRAEAREKWLWDDAARMRQSRSEGLAEGLAKGEAKLHDEKIAMARRLLRMNLLSVVDIAEATALSVAVVEGLAGGKNFRPDEAGDEAVH